MVEDSIYIVFRNNFKILFSFGIFEFSKKSGGPEISEIFRNITGIPGIFKKF
jgi:hypothetical protein